MRRKSPFNGVLAAKTPPRCLRCEVEMVVRRKGYCPPHAHGAHGLCRRCYQEDLKAKSRPPGYRKQWRALDLLAEYEYLMTQPGFRVKADVAARLKLKPATLGRAIVRGRAYRKQAVETAGRAVVMIRYLVDAVTVLGLTAWWRLVQLVTGRDAAPSGS